MKSFVKVIGLSMLIITIIMVNATLAQVKHDPNKPEGLSDAEWQAIQMNADKKPEGTSEFRMATT